MGAQLVVVGSEHSCPMSDGMKAHKGGTVIEGVEGVTINGIPIAVRGSKCICTGSNKVNAIATGCPGIFIDGEPVAIVGSMTEHGGVLLTGSEGVSISGGFPVKAGTVDEPEPRVFNLQWRKKESIVKYGEIEDTVILSADTVGYGDGEEVAIQVFEDGNSESIDEVKGIVKDGRVEVEWITPQKKG